LTLKQQQASIVEAKAALQRAEESVKQGRAIMAFTIVTIFFASYPSQSTHVFFFFYLLTLR